MAKPKLLPAVTAETLPEIIHNHKVVVVHFWAEWNPYDYQMDGRLHSLQPQFAEQRFVALDTGPETSWDFCRQYQVVNLPALACFIGGVWHETLTGLRSEAELSAKLRAWSIAQAA